MTAMINDTDKVVYLSKAMFKFGKAGLDIVRKYFMHVTVIPFDEHLQGESGIKRIREKLRSLDYDYLISFWSEFYVRADELKKAAKGAVNIHPAPPEHPGLGMFSFIRLFPHLRQHHGVTLHEMDEKLDHGKIYRVIRFPVDGMSDMELIGHTGDLTLCLLEDACQSLARGTLTSGLLSPSCVSETWSGSFYTSAMEQEWLKQLPLDHPARRLDCISVDKSILYVEFGAPPDSITETG